MGGYCNVEETPGALENYEADVTSDVVGTICEEESLDVAQDQASGYRFDGEDYVGSCWPGK